MENRVANIVRGPELRGVKAGWSDLWLEGTDCESSDKAEPGGGLCRSEWIEIVRVCVLWSPTDAGQGRQSLHRGQ